MNKKERKEIQNMRLMVEGFGEINKIVLSGSVLDLDDPEQEIQDRYNQILNVLQYVADNLK